MKTVDFKSFAKDAISTKELDYLKGGKGDPVSDILTPPKK